MTTSLASSLYLISGALFILALRGLSSPETSRRGNFIGILGMVLAIIVTFLFVDILFSSLLFIICALAIGGSIGAFIAYRISMTAMPQLVAGFHSLVGLAAVLVALSVFYNPEAFGLGTLNNIKTASLVEMSIGASIGAITFTGSVIAFLKLQGLMSGRPITFKGQHFINLLIGIGIISLIIYITINQSGHIFWILIIISFLTGFLFLFFCNVKSVPPNPPRITLKNDRFIPLHIIYDKIAPDEPTKAPVIISAVFSKVKPIPAAAHPEYELSIEITTGISAPPIGIIKRAPTKKDIMINIQNI